MLRARRAVAQAVLVVVAEMLDERFGVRACYYSVLNSQSPDGIPSFSGKWWDSATKPLSDAVDDFKSGYNSGKN